MRTMIWNVLKRSRSRTFLTSLGLILAAETLTIIFAWRLLDLNVNRWIDEKTAQAMQISKQSALSNDWSRIDKIPIEEHSPPFEQYRQKVIALSQQYFHSKVGSVYIAVVERGEEYDIDTSDPDLVDSGKPDTWELAAYSSRKPTYTPVPISNDSGTYLAAYTPILSRGKVVGLVAAEYDSAPLADLQGIARRIFWSIVPATLVSLVIAYILASMFVEPMEVLRGIEDMRKKDLGQFTDGKSPWNLTDRQLDVFESLGDDLTNAQIATKLAMSPETVKSHMKEILRKSGLKRWQLIVAARERLIQAGTSAGNA